MATDGTTSSKTNGTTGNTKPFEATANPAVGSSIIKQTRKAHTNTLQTLATLSGPMSTTASTSTPTSVPKGTLSGAVDEVLSQAATTTFFGELFSLIQDKGDNVTRLEVDQKLLNWGIAIPGVKEKLATLPPDLANSVQQFRTADVSVLNEGEGVQ